MPTITHKELYDLAVTIEGKPRYQYSGRGMFGRTCVGIVCNDGDFIKLGAAIREQITDRELQDALFNNYSTDDMAKQTIIYWTNITVSEGNDSDWEDD